MGNAFRSRAKASAQVQNPEVFGPVIKQAIENAMGNSQLTQTVVANQYFNNNASGIEKSFKNVAAYVIDHSSNTASTMLAALLKNLEGAADNVIQAAINAIIDKGGDRVEAIITKATENISDHTTKIITHFVKTFNESLDIWGNKSEHVLKNVLNHAHQLADQQLEKHLAQIALNSESIAQRLIRFSAELFDQANDKTRDNIKILITHLANQGEQSAERLIRISAGLLDQANDRTRDNVQSLLTHLVNHGEASAGRLIKVSAGLLDQASDRTRDNIQVLMTQLFNQGEQSAERLIKVSAGLLDQANDKTRDNICTLVTHFANDSEASVGRLIKLSAGLLDQANDKTKDNIQSIITHFGNHTEESGKRLIKISAKLLNRGLDQANDRTRDNIKLLITHFMEHGEEGAERLIKLSASLLEKANDQTCDNIKSLISQLARDSEVSAKRLIKLSAKLFDKANDRTRDNLSLLIKQIMHGANLSLQETIEHTGDKSIQVGRVLIREFGQEIGHTVQYIDETLNKTATIHWTTVAQASPYLARNIATGLMEGVISGIVLQIKEAYKNKPHLEQITESLWRKLVSDTNQYVKSKSYDKSVFYQTSSCYKSIFNLIKEVLDANNDSEILQRLTLAEINYLAAKFKQILRDYIFFTGHTPQLSNNSLLTRLSLLHNINYYLNASATEDKIIISLQYLHGENNQLRDEQLRQALHKGLFAALDNIRLLHNGQLSHLSIQPSANSVIVDTSLSSYFS
jgi:hypothetical protein